MPRGPLRRADIQPSVRGPGYSVGVFEKPCVPWAILWGPRDGHQLVRLAGVFDNSHKIKRFAVLRASPAFARWALYCRALPSSLNIPLRRVPHLCLRRLLRLRPYISCQQRNEGMATLEWPPFFQLSEPGHKSNTPSAA